MSVNKFLGGKLELIAGSTPALGGAGSIVNVQLSSNKGNPISNVEIILNIRGTDYKSTTDNSGLAILSGVQDVGTATISTGLEAYPSRSLKINCFSAYDVLMMDSDPYEDWMTSAGLSASSYASLDELLEDEKAVRTLMTKKESVDILANFITGDDLAAIINHRYAAKWINYREYAYSTLSENEVIKELMDESGMYGMYITAESKSRPLVPVMTSNICDVGEVIVSGMNTGPYAVYYPFDGNKETMWHSAGTSASDGNYIIYKFYKPTKVKRIYVYNTATLDYLSGVQVLASNDGTEWTSLSDTIPYSTYQADVYEDLNNDDFYIYYKVVAHSTYSLSGQTYATIAELQFYGEQLEALIPTMTSDTSPSGEASASDQYAGNYYPYRVFGGNTSVDTELSWITNNNANADQWIQYKFTSPTIVNAVKFRTSYVNQGIPKNIKIQGSNDNSNFDTVYEYLNEKDTVSTDVIFDFSNDKSYLYWRFYIVNSYVGDYNRTGLATLQFYGEPTLWQPKGLVPVMTSNTAPYGEASASTADTSGINCDVHKAFDNNPDTYWMSTSGSNEYIQYKFTNPTCVKRVEFICAVFAKNYTIQASNDNSTWDDIGSFVGTSDNSHNVCDLTNNNYYLYYRVHVVDIHVSNWISMISLQFYGRQLEALIPPMTSNTAPMGEASASSEHGGELKAYCAFSSDSSKRWISAVGDITNVWLQYKFVKPTNVKGALIEPSYHSGLTPANAPKTIKIQASNNETSWVDLHLYDNANKLSRINVMFDNDENYLYYRVFVGELFNNDSNEYTGITTLQFYGAPDYESRTYIYDHGVEVTSEFETYYANGGAFEELSDYLLFQKTNATVADNVGLAIGLSSTVNISNYSIMGCNLEINSSNFGVCLLTAKQINSYTSLAAVMLGQLIPTATSVSYYYDVNNINQYVYIALSALYNPDLITAMLHELWLE